MSVSRAMFATQKSGVAVMLACPMRLGQPRTLTTWFMIGRSIAFSAR
jgi:hypothetical protein